MLELHVAFTDETVFKLLLHRFTGGLSVSKIALKEIDEVIENFLSSLENAEKKVDEVLMRTEEYSGKLVSEAAAESKNLERVLEEALDEVKRVVNEKAENYLKELRESKKKEMEELLRSAQRTFDENFERAVSVILDALFG